MPSNEFGPPLYGSMKTGPLSLDAVSVGVVSSMFFSAFRGVFSTMIGVDGIISF